MPENQAVILKKRCEGVPVVTDFELRTVPMPDPAGGEVLVENIYLSLDPYLRGRIAGRHISGAIAVGDTMPGETVARVIGSNSDACPVGTLVTGHGGWQRYATLAADTVKPVNSHGLAESLTLGVLGMPGLTAYAGMTRLAEMKKGDTVLVSAASGPVGSTVGQIARLNGCRVIGIAGGADKCAWVTDKAGFDACIDYKAEAVRDRLAALAPDGIDIYFDNVGGDILQAAMEQMAVGARVVLCGLMAQYNAEDTPPGPNPGLIIKARATVRGLVVYDHWDLAEDAAAAIAGWIRQGQFACLEDVTDGLENAPDAFVRLMSGRNFGKALVKIGA